MACRSGTERRSGSRGSDGAPTEAEENVLSVIVTTVVDAAAHLWMALQILLLSALAFALLALLVKGREAIAAAERARKEVSVNLSLFILDALFVAPFAA